MRWVCRVTAHLTDPPGSRGTGRAEVWRQSWGFSPTCSRAKATAMPHFLDWFVPVYLVISVLILVGFGACIYYFEPGLQEAHKWRVQRPLVDRDLRKTLMVRDNLAFGGPEV
ncbi:protein SMIM45 isoform X2 [Nycticebus coucang]|uniref:protein SMIM45 isoform X2 n=1 Tax=Nycticebus coucang TaxID=9470 RepID=UPI00234CA511|nr:protein SMIM45 isoform X2 [Nycticebus coucang]